MFEKIHFYQIEQDTIRDKSESIILSGLPGLPEDMDSELTPFVFTENANFTIRGTIRSVLELPMSAGMKEHFIYLQGFGYMSVDRTYFTRRVNYPSYLLLYTYEGEGELIYEEKCYHLCPNRAFLIDCRKEHHYYSLSDCWVHSDLHFFGGNSEYIYETWYRDHSPLYQVSSQDTFQQALEQILLHRERAAVQREFLISTAIEHLLTVLYQQNSNSEENNSLPEYLVFLLQYMDHHFHAPLTLNDLASMAGVSKYYMCHQFKKYLSVSPKEYLTALRISQAKSLLISSTIPAYKIGILVGIPDAKNFLRLFFKYEHMTPTEYRNCHT